MIDEAARETVPRLPAVKYWIALDRLTIGVAFVFSAEKRRLLRDHWSAVPG
jgi:hypothetical protein